MPETGDGVAGEDARRVEELLRVNAELAAEIRGLRAGRIAAPRSAAMPAARQLSRLVAERDELVAAGERLSAERDALSAERDGLLAEVRELNRHRENLEEQVRSYAEQSDALSREVARLRGGAAGLARRVSARISRRG